MAQSAFQGFYGQLGTGYESNSLSSLNSNATVTPVVPNAFATTFPTVTTGNQTASGMPLVAGVGYNYAISNSWLIGIGGDYSFVFSQGSRQKYQIDIIFSLPLAMLWIKKS